MFVDKNRRVRVLFWLRAIANREQYTQMSVLELSVTKSKCNGWVRLTIDDCIHIEFTKAISSKNSLNSLIHFKTHSVHAELSERFRSESSASQKITLHRRSVVLIDLQSVM